MAATKSRRSVLRDHPVDDPVVLGLLRAHEVIPLGVVADFLKLLAGVLGDDLIEPAPDVESAVVEIRTRDAFGVAPRLSTTDEDDLWRLVQAGFRERRKKLRNVLARQLPLSGADVAAALVAAGIDGDRRPQTLSVEEWLALHSVLGPLPGGSKS